MQCKKCISIKCTTRLKTYTHAPAAAVISAQKVQQRAVASIQTMVKWQMHFMRLVIAVLPVVTSFFFKFAFFPEQTYKLKHLCNPLIYKHAYTYMYVHKYAHTRMHSTKL